MSITKTRNLLLQQLAKAYPQQFMHPNTGPINIQLDDQTSGDCYPCFCHIHVKRSSPNPNEFVLPLSNVPPDDVKELATELDGIWDSTRFGERHSLELSV